MDDANRGEADARLTVAEVRAHRPLTDAERDLVRNRIARDLENRAALRGLPLTNGDSPDPPFQPGAAQGVHDGA